MNVSTRYIVPVLIALSFLPVGNLRAEPSIEVGSDMLLWKKGFSYQTEVKAEISLANTKIEVDESGRKAKGEQDRSFYYDGAMVYSTEILVASDYNGTAGRYYARCDMNKAESDLLLLKGEVGYWDVWKSRAGELLGRSLPAEWREKFDVVERNAEVAGGSYIIVRQKPDSPNLLGGGDLELAFQSMGSLSLKWFLFEWTTPRSFGKAAVTVSPAEVESGRLVKTTGGVGKIVKDVIARESKLLYEAMLGSDSDRQEGETWIVEGEALEAMIHPTVEGRFRGHALVKAEEVKGASPLGAPAEMNGLKLKFVRSGTVDGRTIATNLRLVFATVDGGTHETNLVPDDGVFSGEIWLDTENQTVSYGRLTVDKAKYDGYLPKIGELNAKVKLKADLDFELEYIQSITPAEGQTVGE
jgi:hypothetical protein